MLLRSLIEELCTKEENDKKGCELNFGHECISSIDYNKSYHHFGRRCKNKYFILHSFKKFSTFYYNYKSIFIKFCTPFCYRYNVVFNCCQSHASFEGRSSFKNIFDFT